MAGRKKKLGHHHYNSKEQEMIRAITWQTEKSLVQNNKNRKQPNMPLTWVKNDGEIHPVRVQAVQGVEETDVVSGCPS